MIGYRAETTTCVVAKPLVWIKIGFCVATSNVLEISNYTAEEKDWKNIEIISWLSVQFKISYIVQEYSLNDIVTISQIKYMQIFY